MLTYPFGVQQIVVTPAGMGLRPVRSADWKFFCMQQSANAFMAGMQEKLAAQLGGNQLALVDGSEEGFLFDFSSDAPNATPRLWYIMGQDAQGNQICEMAGYLIDRQSVPDPSTDKGWIPGAFNPATGGNTPQWPNGAKLQMNLSAEYGYAELFYSITAAAAPAVPADPAPATSTPSTER